MPSAPPAALPALTFGAELTLHWNGEEIHAFHAPAAHTDGDAIVHFRRADALHTGDVFVSGHYPFLDLESGGSLAGHRALAIARSRSPTRARASSRATARSRDAPS